MSFFAAFDAVVGVAHAALEALAGVSTPAAAVILFTAAVRLLISPLTYLQVRGERRRAALAPQVKQLREKYSDDPLALAAETIALQRAAGAGPFVSLLPALAQAPFFMVMYRVVTTGFPLGGGWPVTGLLVVIALALAWWSSRRMRRVSGDTPRWLTLVPYLTVPVVVILPVAGGVYVVTSSAWTALEHAVWRRPVKAGD